MTYCKYQKEKEGYHRLLYLKLVQELAFTLSISRDRINQQFKCIEFITGYIQKNKYSSNIVANFKFPKDLKPIILPVTPNVNFQDVYMTSVDLSTNIDTGSNFFSFDITRGVLAKQVQICSIKEYKPKTSPNFDTPIGQMHFIMNH